MRNGAFSGVWFTGAKEPVAPSSSRGGPDRRVVLAHPALDRLGNLLISAVRQPGDLRAPIRVADAALSRRAGFGAARRQGRRHSLAGLSAKPLTSQAVIYSYNAPRLRPACLRRSVLVKRRVLSTLSLPHPGGWSPDQEIRAESLGQRGAAPLVRSGIRQGPYLLRRGRITAANR